LNIGLRRRKQENDTGFLIEPSTGRWLSADNAEDAAAAAEEDPTRGTPQRIVPMVEDHKNTLLLRPAKPFADAITAVVVQHALLRGLETEFQLEEGELLSEPMPGRDDRRSILFYEATEGGAGVLARVARERDVLARVTQQALRVMHFEWTGKRPTPATLSDGGAETCVKGCYRCLLTYFNQPEHEKIDRHHPEALDFLCRLAAATVHSKASPLPAIEPQTTEGDPTQRFRSRLEAQQIPVPKVKVSGAGWQLTWQQHLVVVLFGPTSADRRTLEDMDYRVFEVPLEETRWVASIEALKSALEAREQ
jgi:Domain of unknown function (DUF1998)